MKKVISVHLSPMFEAVLSKVLLKYEEGNSYSFLEENGTIKNLCAKYQIIRKENECYDSRHLVGKKFMTKILEGKTIFLGYC